jgi:hypothetical protein
MRRNRILLGVLVVLALVVAAAMWVAARPEPSFVDTCTTHNNCQL